MNHYISVSNGILEPKHQERIGTSIWVYLWCLDRVTKIRPDGMGLVLGGKPVKLEDIECGHRVTVSRHLSKLAKEGYLVLIHAPYGVVIRVVKAKKWFSQSANPIDVKKNDKKAKPPRTESLNLSNKKAKPVYKKAKPNKTSTDDSSIKTKGAKSQSDPALVVELIDAFKEVNLAFGQWYRNKTERGAADRLISAQGLETVLSVVRLLPKTNAIPYMPTITKPSQLEDKWLQLKAALERKKEEVISKGRGLA